MCGICGMFGPAAPPTEDDRAVVGQMMRRLAHRGPDDEGMVDGKGFVLGHRRLSIIDLEHGSQPMSSPDGRYVVCFNGEIYNYLELRQQLIQGGGHFQTFSDTEVLLRMLTAHGREALPQLNGMFAFAFVDRSTGRWLLARDPLGVKPLYVATVGETLLFASEIKALLAHPGLRAEVDSAALQEYLSLQFCLGDRTLFQGVRKIEPGGYLAGRGGEVEASGRYWDMDFEVDEYHTVDYFVDRLRALLDDSARLQVRSDVPLGAHASGGLDSSTISVLAAGHVRGALPLFHGKFAEGAAYDESSYAEALAQSIGGRLETVVPTASQFVEDLPRLIEILDEPVAGPGVFPQYRVSKLASEHVKVVLGGQGGDEIFCGYARYLVGYLEQALKGAIFETQEEGRHIVTLESIISNLPVLQQYRPLMQHFWRRGLFDDMDARYFHLINRSPDLDRILTSDARARFDWHEVFEQFKVTFNHPQTRSYVNKMTHFDMKTLLPALLQIEDRVSMAWSLESRVPLLDTRIVDLVTRMPPSVKFRGGRTKHVFRQAVRNIVPQVVRDRQDKMGFPVPLREWMSGGPVRTFANDVLRSRSCRERGLFAAEAVDELLTGEAAFGRQLWGALCLELWHQRFVDGAV